MIDSEEIFAKDQWEYWTGVGMLFYLVKHSCPSLTNATRELSKVNDDANPTAYKKLLCEIKYVLDTDNLELKTQTHGEF